MEELRITLPSTFVPPLPCRAHVRCWGQTVQGFLNGPESHDCLVANSGLSYLCGVLRPLSAAPSGPCLFKTPGGLTAWPNN